MTIAYSHTTARDIYRLAAAGLVPRLARTSQRLPHAGGTGVRALCRQDMRWLRVTGERARERGMALRLPAAQDAWREETPLVTTVFREADKRRSASLSCRCAPSLADEPVFRGFVGAQYVVSPELLYVNMADELSDEAAVAAFGCELCGSYALLPRGIVSLRALLQERRRWGLDEAWDGPTPDELARGEGFVKRPPLTTPGRLRRFLEAHPELRGATRARAALRWVTPGSASPMETASALLLRMSQRLGGYGLGKPALNEPVGVSERWQALLGVERLRVDVLYVTRGGTLLGLEYQGWRWHTGRERMVHDNRRRLALEDAGVELIFVTWEDLVSPVLMGAVAERIARRLDLGARSLAPAVLTRRAALHARLTAPDFGR